RGEARSITATGGIENDPAVSPDGKRLALAVQQADYDIIQVSADRPAPAVVVGTSRNEMDPVWSRSLSAMAFTTDRSGREEIWLPSQDGRFERPLVMPESSNDTQTEMLGAPAISPDGSRIAYYRNGRAGPRLWVTPVAGGPAIELTPGNLAQDSPTWSPDG